MIHNCPECQSNDVDIHQRDGEVMSLTCVNCRNHWRPDDEEGE
jgi:Zn ribbon nucleic-acid-binding protein